MSATTKTEFKHITRRCSNEDAVTAALNEATNKGYQLLATGVGGTDGNVMWLVFQGRAVIQVQPEPVMQAPTAPATPLGGGIPALD